MKQLTFTLLLLTLLTSCKKTKEVNVRSCTFYLPKNELFVKTSKYKGGIFSMSFAKDSLSLKDKKDYIEFDTKSFIRIIVDSTTIYLADRALTRSYRTESFVIKIIDSTTFHKRFFNNSIPIKPQYDDINIGTSIYWIIINGDKIKEGDMYGGWNEK